KIAKVHILKADIFTLEKPDISTWGLHNPFRIRDFMLNSPQQRAIFNTKNYMLLRHKDSYAAPLAKTVFSLPFVVICNSAK
ncbi:hypothetical protein, partial [Acinetobacter indicus]|uniref:hypothetical protein n=1 Tax=Acinetobacter indicus TaxID=756892 RepID=UPI002579020B